MRGDLEIGGYAQLGSGSSMHAEESASFGVAQPVTHHLPIRVGSSGTALLELGQHATEDLVGIATGGPECFVLSRCRSIGVVV